MEYRCEEIHPVSEEKGQRVYTKAFLDNNVLSSQWIFMARQEKVPEGRDDVMVVKITKVLLGDGLKTGQKAMVRLCNASSNEAKPCKDDRIYFCNDRYGDDGYFESAGLPAAMEPAVRDALARRDKYPVVTLKECGSERKVREIVFTGSTDEAIEFLSSEDDVSASFICHSLIYRGQSVHDRLAKEIRLRLFQESLTPPAAKTQERLIGIMSQIDGGEMYKILEELIAHLESAGASKDSDNPSIRFLLGDLYDLDVARRCGKRLLALPGKLGPKCKAVLESAFAQVQLADRVELSAVLDRSAHLPVIRTEKPPQPTSMPYGPNPAEVINKFFCPAYKRMLIFAPDASVLRSVTREGFLHTRDPVTLAIRHEVKLPDDFIFISAKPPDGKYALIAKVVKRDGNRWPEDFGNMRVIEFDTGKPVVEIQPALRWGSRASLFWLPNSDLLFMATGEQDPYIFPSWCRVDGRTGKVLEKVDVDLAKGGELSTGDGELTEDGQSLLFLPIGKFSRQTVRACDLRTLVTRTVGRLSLPVWGGGTPQGLVPGGKYFFVSCGGLNVFDRTTLKPAFPPLLPKDGFIDAAFSPDGTKVAVTTWNRLDIEGIESRDLSTIIRIQDLKTGKTLWAIPWSRLERTPSLTFSPDGNRLLLLRDDNVIEAHDLKPSP
jgi:hypothetical protein